MPNVMASYNTDRRCFGLILFNPHALNITLHEENLLTPLALRATHFYDWQLLI